MAALNTLRTKGGIVLSIFIGIALVAFLLGDMNSKGSSQSISVGTINGEDVMHQEYYASVDKFTNANLFMSRKSSLSQQETEAVQQQAWQQILIENLLTNELEELGVSISDAEMVDMTSGSYISPVISSVFRGNSGLFDKEIMQNFVANLDMDQSGRSREFWLYVEEQMTQERSLAKYNKLVEQAIYVTDLEISNGVKNTNDNVNFDFVTKSISVIADSLVSVSDATLREYYKKNIDRYKQSASRNIRYVIFEALPSVQDYKVAEEYFMALSNDFKVSKDFAQFVNLNSENNFTGRYVTKANVPSYVKNLSKGAFFGPEFKNDTYTSAVVVDVKNIPDSVTFEFAIIPSTMNVDSLVKVMNASRKGFSKVLAKISKSNTAVQPAEKVTLNTSDLAVEMINEIVKVKIGRTVAISRGGVSQIIKMLSKTKNVAKAQIAELQYNVVPSGETEQIIYSQASEFVNKVDNSTEFANVSQEDALLVRVATLTPQSNDVSGLDNSREIVRWAFNNESGSVSHVVTLGSKNIIATLVDVKSNGVISFEDVKTQIKSTCMAEAKAVKLASEMASLGSMDAIASKYDVKVASATDINFNSFYIPGLGVAPSVIGKVTSMKVDAQSSPIISSSQVTVVKVTGSAVKKDVDSAKEKALLQSQMQTNIAGRVFGSFMSNANIEDNRVLYF